MAKPYAAVPRALVVDSRVPNGAKVLYAVLTRYADQNRQAWPSQATVAAELNGSTRTVERSVAALRETGWVAVERRWPGGPNRYTLHVEPLETEETEETEEADGAARAPQEPCGALAGGDRGLTPPAKLDATHPPAGAAHTNRYLLNETPLAPAGALRAKPGPDGVEQGFDPAEVCGLFDASPPPAPAAQVGARALACELRESWRRDRPGALPGDINVAAVSGQIAALRRGGVTTAELRAMIALFCAVKGYLVDGAAPWKCFLARRHVLLTKVRAAAEAEAAQNDPDYWKPKKGDWREESAAWYAEQFGKVLT